MRLRIVSLFALICATAFTVTGCNQSIVGTTSGTQQNAGDGASYVFATNFNAATQQGTVESFPINHIGTSNAAVPPASTTVYPGEVSAVNITSAGFGYTAAPTIVIAPPTTLPINGGVTATATATINSTNGGSISGITITNPGSGYTASPAVTVLVAGSIAPPAGANGAVLTSTVPTPFIPFSSVGAGTPPVITFQNGNTVATQLRMDGIADGRIYYASYPFPGITPDNNLPQICLQCDVTIHFLTAPNPTSVIIANGIVSALTLTNINAIGGGSGSGYITAPQVVLGLPTIPGGIPATAVATLGATTGSVTGVSFTATASSTPGTGYTAPPTVTFAAPGTSVANGGVTATGTAVLSTSTGPISSIAVTSGGAGYGVAPLVTIAAPTTLGSTQAVGTATVANGVVTGITLSPAGTGYTAAPLVLIAPPPPATATAVLSGNTVGSVTVTNGQIGYTSAPSITFSGGGGTGAAGVPTLNAAGTVIGITVTSPGSGYTSAPSVTLSAAPAATAGATVLAPFGAVASVTINNPGAGYEVAPVVTFSPPAAVNFGTGVQATAVAAVTGAGNPGGGVVTSVALVNAGTNYTSAPAVTIAPPTSGTTATAVAFLNTNGTVGGITVTNAGSGYTTATPAVTLGAPNSPQFSATAVLGNSPELGSISAINVTAASPITGFTAAPVVTIASPPATAPTASSQTGTTGGASATTPITAGSITGPFTFTTAQVNPNYTAAPTCTVSAPTSGTTASVSPIITVPGPVTGFNIVAPNFGGVGYTTTATITCTAPPAAGATATAVEAGGIIPLTGATFNFTTTVNQVGPGSAGYLTPPACIVSPPTSGVTAGVLATLTAGSVTGFTVINGGSGYTSNPTITCAAPPAATAVANVNASGVLTGVTVNSGSGGYLTAPTVTISAPPPGGSTPAVGTGIISTLSGPVASLTITNPGSGYTAAPSVSIAPPPAAVVAVSTINGNGVVTAINVSGGGDNGGAGFTVTPGSGTGPVPVILPPPTATAFANLGTVAGVTGAVASLTLGPPLNGSGFSGGGYETLAGVAAPPTVTIAAPPTAAADSVLSAATGVSITNTLGVPLIGNSVSGINLVANGGGYAGPCTYPACAAPLVTVANPPAAAGTAVLNAAGQVTSITVTSAGGGYISAPTVTLGAPSVPSATASINAAGQVTGVTIGNASGGLNPATTVAFTAAPAASADKAVATAIISTSGANAGQVTGFSITNPGLDYVSGTPPLITIAAPGGTGTTATATAIINTNGQLANFTIVNPGSGYLSAPTVTIPAPLSTTTATGTVVLNGNNGVASITINNPGAGYTVAPTITFSPAAPLAAAQATATAQFSTTGSNIGQITGFTVTDNGNGYTAPPTVTITACASAPAPPTAPVSCQAVTQAGVSVNSFGQITNIVVSNPTTNFGYTNTNPTVTIAAPPGSSTATATAQVTGGAVSGFTFGTHGFGYPVAPAVTIAAPAATSTATATSSINSAGVITAIQVTLGGAGYQAAPIITIPGNGNGGITATATATVTGAIPVGTVGVGKVVTDVMDSNFSALAVDRGANIYVSEADGHLIVFPTADNSVIPLQAATGNAPVNSTPVDFDFSAAGENISPNGFQIMATDLNNNLYGYVAGSGVITQFISNSSYQFPPYIQGVINAGLNPPAQCATGHTQCLIGNIPQFSATAGPSLTVGGPGTPAFTISPPLASPVSILTSRLFPLPAVQYTLPASITNVVDFVVDLFSNIDVLSLNAGTPSVTQFAPCTPPASAVLTAAIPTCTLVATKTISGSNTGFNTPGSIAVDTLTNIYVEDFNPTAVSSVPVNGTPTPTAGYLNDFLIFNAQASGNVAPVLSFTAAPTIDVNSINPTTLVSTPLSNANTNPVQPPPAAVTTPTPAGPGYGLGVF